MLKRFSYNKLTNLAKLIICIFIMFFCIPSIYGFDIVLIQDRNVITYDIIAEILDTYVNGSTIIREDNEYHFRQYFDIDDYQAIVHFDGKKENYDFKNYTQGYVKEMVNNGGIYIYNENLGYGFSIGKYVDMGDLILLSGDNRKENLSVQYNIIEEQKDHPILIDIPDFTYDEWEGNLLTTSHSDATVLMNTLYDGNLSDMVIVKNYGQGQVVAFSHAYHDSIYTKDPFLTQEETRHNSNTPWEDLTPMMKMYINALNSAPYGDWDDDGIVNKDDIDDDNDGINDSNDEFPYIKADIIPDQDNDGVPDDRDDYDDDPAKVMDFPLTILGLVPDMKLWLTASVNAIELGDSNKIRKWYDWSGNQNHASQESGNEMPQYTENVLNNLPGISFDGINHYLNIPVQLMQQVKDMTTPEFTYVILFNWKGGGNGQRLYDFGSDSQYHVFLTTNSGAYARMGITANDGEELVYPNPLNTNQDTIFMTTFKNQDKMKGYGNGVLEATKDTTKDFKSIPQVNHFIGKSPYNNSDAYLNADIYEILVFNKVLDDSEKIQVHRYLADKWGLNDTVDSDDDGLPDANDINPTDSTQWAEFPDILRSEPSNKYLPIDNLAFWVSSSENAVYKDDSDKIQTWYDWSGNNRHLTQEFISNKPEFKSNAIDFGTYQSFDATIIANLFNTDYQLFIVITPEPTGGYFLETKSGSTSRHFLGFQSGSGQFSIQANNGSMVVPGENNHNQATLLSIKGSENENKLTGYINNTDEGELLTSYYHTDLDTVYLGASSFKGKINEIIIISQNMTPYEQNLIENYLDIKWDLDLPLIDDDFDGVPNTVDEFPNDPDKVIAIPPTYNVQNSQNEQSLQLWLDASSPNAVQLLDEYVHQWYDLSGKRNHAKSPVNNRPYYGEYSIKKKNVVHFESNAMIKIEDTLQNLKLQEHTIIAVFTHQSGNHMMGFNTISNLNSTSYHISIDNNKLEYKANFNSSTAFNVGSTELEEKTYVISGIYDKSKAELYIDSELIDTESTALNAINIPGTAYEFRIGGMNNSSGIGFSTIDTWTGDVAEIVIFDKALTDEERLNIETHLLNKWQSIADEDDDGVPDEKDNYPADPEKVVDFPDELDPIQNEQLHNKLWIWLQASENAVEYDDSNKISSWYDWSGNQHHVLQDSTDNQPIFNDSLDETIRFDGTNDFMMFDDIETASTQYTFLFVINPTNASKLNQTLFDSNTIDIKYVGNEANYSAVLHNGQLKRAGKAQMGRQLMMFTFKNDQIIYERNGNRKETLRQTSQQALPNSAALGSNSNGLSEYMEANWAEVLIFKDRLTNQEKKQLRQYIHRKWDIKFGESSTLYMNN